MDHDRKIVFGFSVGALAWCAAAGLLLWFLPLGSSSSSSSSGVTVASDGQSFASLSELGPVPLIIPLVLTAIAAWCAYRRRWLVLAIATALLAVYSLLTGFSIGLAYLPAVGALLVASIAAFRADSRTSGKDGVGGRV